MEASIITEQTPLIDQSALQHQMIERYFDLWKTKPEKNANSSEDSLPSQLPPENTMQIEQPVQKETLTPLLECLIEPILMKVISQLNLDSNSTIEKLAQSVLINLNPQRNNFNFEGK